MASYNSGREVINQLNATRASYIYIEAQCVRFYEICALLQSSNVLCMLRCLYEWSAASTTRWNPHTRASTHLRCTFILTCSPRISVSGPKIFIQSFFRGVIRCGGIAIRLVSDFNLVLSAFWARGGNAGAEDTCGKSVGSVSIINASSSKSAGLEGIGGFAGAAASPITSSSLAFSEIDKSAMRGAFREILRRFFRPDKVEVEDSGWVTTISRQVFN